MKKDLRKRSKLRDNGPGTSCHRAAIKPGPGARVQTTGASAAPAAPSKAGSWPARTPSARRPRQQQPSRHVRRHQAKLGNKNAYSRARWGGRGRFGRECPALGEVLGRRYPGETLRPTPRGPPAMKMQGLASNVSTDRVAGTQTHSGAHHVPVRLKAPHTSSCGPWTPQSRGKHSSLQKRHEF